MRESRDELAQDGSILNGFDYELQVWVVDGVCTDVGSGRKYAGRKVVEVPGHEVRTRPLFQASSPIMPSGVPQCRDCGGSLSVSCSCDGAR